MRFVQVQQKSPQLALGVSFQIFGFDEQLVGLAGQMLHLNGVVSFKIWIDASPGIRAERIAGREDKTAEQVRVENEKRESIEYQRYKNIYDIDCRSLAVYDMVLNSDDMTPDEIVAQIIREARLE